MQIKVISSGSKANSVLVSDGRTNLLLDAGLTYSKLSKQVRFSQVDAVFISHCHMDHCRAVPELLRRGVTVLTSQGTIDAMGYTGATPIKHLQQIEVGSWLLKPFDVLHDAPEPMGLFFHSTETGERGLYLVDSQIIEFSFPGVTHYLIEANYQEELLEAGPYEDYLKDRVRRNHFSLENLKVFLRTSDLSKTEEIWLLHMSDSNSDETGFVNEIQSLTGVPTYAA